MREIESYTNFQQNRIKRLFYVNRILTETLKSKEELGIPSNFIFGIYLVKKSLIDDLVNEGCPEVPISIGVDIFNKKI